MQPRRATALNLPPSASAFPPLVLSPHPNTPPWVLLTFTSGCGTTASPCFPLNVVAGKTPLRRCCGCYFLNVQLSLFKKFHRVLFWDGQRLPIRFFFFFSPCCLADVRSWLMHQLMYRSWCDHNSWKFKFPSQNFNMYFILLWGASNAVWCFCPHGFSHPTVNRLCIVIWKPTSQSN